VEETDEGVVVRVEAPGFERDEFEVRRLGDLLSICAEHLLGQVRLAVPLPPGLAQAETVEMTYHDGKLVLRLPRKPEAAGLPAAAEIRSRSPRVAS
jgi:HSP20 family molecular chaperone IbpA